MKREVIKRDGTLEDYTEEKIKKVVTAAGINPDEAKTLAGNITKWLEKNNMLKVTSLQIRDHVIDELKKVNQYAANFFIWYEKTKDS